MPDPAVRVVLKPGEEARLREGHPWVYANEVAKIHGKLSPGSQAEVIGSKGKFIGRGLASPASKILIRLLTWDEGCVVDEALIARRVAKAVEARRPLKSRYNTDGLRLIFGEADGLPGLIVDAFGDRAVLSCFSAGLSPFLPVVTETLAGQGIQALYERSAGETRQKEGMPDTQGFIRGEAPFPWPFREEKAQFETDPSSGQKTGFYLDFRLARREIAALATGKKILDAFCYQGAASIQAALNGAARVTALDSSEHCLDTARRNARMNGVEGIIEFKKADSFQALKASNKEGDLFDGIVLDPPPLAKSVHDLPAGQKALQRLVVQAIHLLLPGGFLVAASCSHHLNWEILEKAVLEACRETGRRFILAERLTQPADHPVLLAVPETEYLRVVVLKEITR